MRLALLSTFATLSGLGLAVPVAQPSPTDIIAIFTSLTSKCQALVAPANQLSVINAPLLLLGSGPWAVPNPPHPCFHTALEIDANKHVYARPSLTALTKSLL